MRTAILFACGLIAVFMAACDDDSTQGSGNGGAGASVGAGGAGGGTGGTAGSGGVIPDGDVTVEPATLDDVLVNPGMGLANFHFGWWCNLPPVTYSPQECADRVLSNWPSNHPGTGTAYFRWSWRELEPVRDQIDFDMIDRAIQSANALGETFSFRVMTISEGGQGIPDWLTSAPYSVTGQWEPSGGSTTFWPDYRDATFQAEHARFVEALAQRYDDHPALDHIDIGSVGCWGEWNTACLDAGGGLIEIYGPQDDGERQQIATAYEDLIDHFTASFETTPLVMLGIGEAGGYETDVLVHAIAGGTGWRVDCWGDWGVWGPGWSHHADLYPAMIAEATAAYPAFPDAWQQAPIQLEVCATMPDWSDLGWTTSQPDGEVYKTFQWALEQHASVLNAKFTAIPSEYLGALDDLLRHNGYRFVLQSFNHHSTVAAGAETAFVSQWSNAGVAPMYIRRTLTYRLRSGTDAWTFDSAQDLRNWLPGGQQVADTITLPNDLPPGSYDLEVAIVDRAGTNPTTAPLAPLQLGIAGRGSDGWYAISQLTVE